MKLSVVIPVYNEVNTILEILRRVKSVPIDKEIIIIDDFSNDGTREVLKELKDNAIRVIFNQKNEGKGFSLRKGFECVTGDIVIIQDADLEYYPNEYPALVQKIIEGKADVVYGTRFLGSRRIFLFYHYLGNKLLNLIANIIYNANLSDLMSCYKVFRSDLLEKLKLRANGFGFEAEITAQFYRLKLRLYEVPISYDGRDYDEGKKATWKAFFCSLYWLIKCKFDSYDVSTDTLYIIKLMKNHNRWLFTQIKPYLAGNILEIGSGIGTISRILITTNSNLVLSDIKKDYLENLYRSFGANPKVKIIKYDVLSAEDAHELPFKIKTAVCLNVLEHLEDDKKALRNIYNILDQNGRLILVVPAMRTLYGSLDKKIGHRRRYEKADLVKKIEENGFLIDKIYYFSLFAAVGWFINGRILRKKRISGLQVSIYDKLVPLISKFEKVIKAPFGLSLIAICRTPDKKC